MIKPAEKRKQNQAQDNVKKNNITNGVNRILSPGPALHDRQIL
jgi:hypothetical protein